MAIIPKFEDCCQQYEVMWSHIAINPVFAAEANRIAQRILSDAKRYQYVANYCGVPWWLVGVLHHMEAGGDFTKHLHNGDPLSAPTFQVPAHRPPGKGPFTWEASAVDALKLKKLHEVGDWSFARVAYEIERFNGFGYRLYHSTVPSPYLWSGTNQYTCGKYSADGKFDPHFVSKQCGALTIIHALINAGVDIETPHPAALTVAEPTVTESFPRAHPEEQSAWDSSTLWAAGSGGVVGGLQVVKEVSNATNEAKSSGLLDILGSAFTSTGVLFSMLLLAVLAFVFKERLLKMFRPSQRI